MGIITLQCSCCGERRSVVYTALNAATMIKNGWGSYGNALYCPECTRTWKKRNGTNRPMPGKFNTLRIIDELYIESAPKHVVEYCSNCENENEFRWDVEEDGFKAYCPHCGAVLMLCDECVHREDAPWVCTTESTPERECARTIKMLAESEEHKMNYMKNIAEMLGVEINEEFKVRSTKYTQNVNSEIFVFTKVGITTDDGITRNDILIDLLLGVLEIVKLPWKPKDGDHYWYVEYDEGCALCRTTWSDSSYDLALYKLSKLYRTREEADMKSIRAQMYTLFTMLSGCMRTPKKPSEH